MTSLGRAFVAVVPPDHVLDAIEARVAPVRAAHDELRWSRRQQWHLTMRFLGRVSEVEGLVGALRHEVGSKPRVGGVGVIGAGAFPTASRASVVWFGVGDGADALTRVAEAVECASVAVGFEPEERAFAPHLTVARVPRRMDVSAVLAALGDEPVGAPWPVDEVVLVQSTTRPTGSVYSEIARVRLATMGA